MRNRIRGYAEAESRRGARSRRRQVSRRQGSPAVKYLGYSRTIVFVFIVGDFSARNPRWQVGWRGTEPVRAFGWRVYVLCRFFRGGFLD